MDFFKNINYHFFAASDESLSNHVSSLSPRSEYEPVLTSLRRMQNGLVEDTLRLGTDLVAEIRSEPDFPPHYLSNISAKMDQLRAKLRLLETRSAKLRERSEYESAKDKFYAEFDDLGRKVQGLESWLASLDYDAASEGEMKGERDEAAAAAAAEAAAAASSSSLPSAAAPSAPSSVAFSSSSPPLRRRERERALEQLEQCTKRKALLTSFGHVIAEMKRLAGEVTLHPGAAEDPANTIKADVYQFCDRWEEVEREFARKEAALIERTSAAAASREAAEDEDERRSNTKWKRCSSDMMLSAPIYVRGAESMQDEILRLKERLKRGASSDRYDVSKKEAVESRISCLEAELVKLNQFDEEIEGISRWMREVEVFLGAEDPAVGDRATLEAQLKESNALQDDIETLKPNLACINENGGQLLNKCAPTESFRNRTY